MILMIYKLVVQGHNTFCLAVLQSDYDDYITIGREYTHCIPYIKRSLISFLHVRSLNSFPFSYSFIDLYFSPFFFSQETSLRAHACLLTMILSLIDIFVSENFLMGYHMVFDRENLSFGWSRSNCEYFSHFKKFIGFLLI